MHQARSQVWGGQNKFLRGKDFLDVKNKFFWLNKIWGGVTKKLGGTTPCNVRTLLIKKLLLHPGC